MTQVKIVVSFLFFIISTTTYSASELDPKVGIYRIDNQRFERYSINSGAVYLPMASDATELSQGALCESHLDGKRVTKIRINNLSRRARANSQKIIELVQKCTKDFLKGIQVRSNEEKAKSPS